MVICPGLLMRSREDQPCVQRCFGTSPPLFLQCYCFFSSLIVSCAKATHRQEQDETSICITLHSSFLTATIPLPDIHLVLIRLLCGLRPLNPSFIHAYSYVQSCLVLCVIQLRQKSKGIFFPHSVYFSD